MKVDEECKILEDRHAQRMRGLQLIENEMSRLRKIIEDKHADADWERLLNWLSLVDPSTNYNSALERYALSTGAWLVEESGDFDDWTDAPNSQLWISGKGTTCSS
jgi:hypothetical protein